MPTAAELRRLPSAEQDAILAEAADRAVYDYRRDPALTAFEAFGPENLYGDSTCAQFLADGSSTLNGSERRSWCES